MNISEGFFLKNRLAVMKIARDMYIANPGDKIPTITEYSERFGISRGTVSQAFMFLTNQNSVEIQKRGHQGSILLEKNDEALWQYTDWGSLTGGMPLPLHSLVAGLATGISECMKQKHVYFNCVFMQGSRTRMNALENNKYDFVIASRLTAQLLNKEYKKAKKVMDLEGVFYSGSYGILFAEGYRTVEDGMTIAVDSTSIDQLYLTDLLCRKKKLKRKECSYISAYQNVVKKNADLVVGRSDVLKDGYSNLFFTSFPAFDKEQEKDIRKYSEAVVFTNEENYGIDRLLNKVLCNETITSLQHQVMNQEIPPQYY